MVSQRDVLEAVRILTPRDCSVPKKRFGSAGDGGYVIPNDLEGIDAAISFGIGGEVSFDLELAVLDMAVLQFDPTVEGPPRNHPNFNFRKVGWSSEPGPESVTLAGAVELANQ